MLMNLQSGSGRLAVGPIAPGVFDNLSTERVSTTESGFLIVYVDNQTIGKDVWFDNVQVLHYNTQVLEENHYYPYGLTLSATAMGITEQKYKYQGIELEKSFGLEMYETYYRIHDPQLGIFRQIDPQAELDYGLSPFASMRNNPAYYTDPLGDVAGDFFNDDGKRLGTDGIDDKKKYVVTSAKEAKSIEKTNKSGGTTQLNSISSAVLLPNDVALNESLDVLDRTIKNGGKKEESSIVMKDGKILKGEPGAEVVYGQDEYAGAKLPAISSDLVSSVEATIHSHPTATEVVGESVYSGNALEPSPKDKPTFKQYKTNIIVGPLGRSTANEAVNTRTGQMETKVTKQPFGIVIYNNSSIKQIQLTVGAVKKILGK